MSEINNKQRLLRLLAYLQKNTDVDHQASMADLCKVMGYENAEAGRKTLSRDLKILMEEGTGVEVSRGSRASDMMSKRGKSRILLSAQRSWSVTAGCSTAGSFRPGARSGSFLRIRCCLFLV